MAVDILKQSAANVEVSDQEHILFFLIYYFVLTPRSRPIPVPLVVITAVYSRVFVSAKVSLKKRSICSERRAGN